MVAKPLVSVLILTYNHSEFISEALDSVINQDYDNLEIVISDDCSTDNTIEIIREYELKYPNISGYFNESNLGIVQNCNRGLSYCKGDYIAFLAGDDLFINGKISAQVNWFNKNSNRVICGHDSIVFESETLKEIRVDGVSNKKFDVFSWISDGMIINAQSLMVKKKAIPNIGFDTRLKIVSDWKFVIDILLESNGECGVVSGVYSKYRMHQNNITKLSREITSDRFKQSYFDQLLTISYFESFYPQYIVACKIRRIKLFYSNLIHGFQSRDYTFLRYYLFSLNPLVYISHFTKWFFLRLKRIISD
jgi:glycosyltransferase involved in cell wall biosynthesis